MARISDTNAQRRLRFGQATMLGVVFEQRCRFDAQWRFRMPGHLIADVSDPWYRRYEYVSGPWHRRRCEAVDAALRVLGVIE
jgi:hypothetical protein